MHILNWWNNLLPLSDEEKQILHTPLVHMRDSSECIKYCIAPEETSVNEWESFKRDFFNRLFMPYTLQDKQLSFEISATTFINYLFDTYVDDETLVISTDSEHPNVKKRLNTSKNTYILNLANDILTYSINKIISEAKKYKKVFVYIIGTKNSTGEITPQEFFIQLKEAFDKNDIKYKLVIDDVQGMFLVPRDYSIFDYVIGTAHALCTGYDMGILISNQFEFGKKAYNWGKFYLEHLDIMLKRRNKINMFKNVAINYYNKYINKENVLANPLSVPYIFYLKYNNLKITEETSNRLHRLNLLIPAYNFSLISFIHMRCHEFINNANLLPSAISILDFILENETNLNEDELNLRIDVEFDKLNFK